MRSILNALVSVFFVLSTLYSCEQSQDAPTSTEPKYTMDYLEAQLDKGGVYEDAVIQDYDFEAKYKRTEGMDGGSSRGNHIGLKYKSVVFSGRGGCIRVPANGNKGWSIVDISNGRERIKVYTSDTATFFGLPVRKVIGRLPDGEYRYVQLETSHFRVRKVDNALDIILLENPTDEAIEIELETNNLYNHEWITIIQKKKSID